MRASPASPETQYERNQRFNALVAWLHSFRYRNILGVFRAIARQTGARSIKVVEVGCAHAKLFSLLHEHFKIDYTGIEKKAEFVAMARARYGHFPNFQVVHASATDVIPQMEGADVIVVLETFEHIAEHDVVRLVEAIAVARPALLVCSVPVEVGPAVWLKNVGSLLNGYMRHKEYRWVETFWAGLYQLDRLPPHGTGHIGFDWRWLAQTIRHNLKIREIRRFPIGFFPAAFAFSVFMIAEPRR